MSTLPFVSSRLSDIAAQAGVSAATVSRVLNNRAGVAEATRQAVLTAVGVLGYERPALLRSRSVGLVGCADPRAGQPGVPVVRPGHRKWLGAMGLHLAAVHQGSRLDQRGGVHRSAARARRGRDHLRVRGARGHHGRYLPLPRVAQGRVATGVHQRVRWRTSTRTFLSTDDLSAMDLAVRHLVELGHTRIGLAIGPDRYVPTIRKIAGFQQAMSRRLGDADAGRIAVTLYTVEGGHAAAVQLLDDGCTGHRLRVGPDGARRDPRRPGAGARRSARTCPSSDTTTRQLMASPIRR